MIDTPPLPPGIVSPLHSPRWTEHRQSLGRHMLKAAPVPAFVPQGFTMTNISVLNGKVTLAWMNGAPPFQVQENNGHGWVNAGASTTNHSQTISLNSPQCFYRVRSGPSPPTDSTIWVGPDGDDSTAVRGMKDRPFKTLYNCQDTNSHTFYGAVTAAQAGDTLVVLPGITYAPACPLNRTSVGLNLYVSAGAMLARTNKYCRQDGTIQSGMAADSTVGPFIIPGNGSKIIVDGQVLVTNQSAIFGWWDSRDTVTPFYGYTNCSATNVVLSGSGKFAGTLDGIYCNQTNPAISSLNVSNLTLSGLYDNIYVNGNCDFTTSSLESLVGTAYNISRGVAIGGGVAWTDYGSHFGCGGAATTYPLYVAPGTIVNFNGTSLYVLTQNTLSTNNPAGSGSKYFFWSDPISIVEGDFIYTDEKGNADHVFRDRP